MRNELAAIATEFGTPCFAYDLDAIASRAKTIGEAFGPQFTLSYAVKANPNTALLMRLATLVGHMDISSAGELTRLQGIGWDTARISFTGPGKTKRELAAAVSSSVGHIVVESVDEAELISALAKEQNAVQPILVRIAPANMPPGFGVSMAGRSTPFGIDEEDAESAIARLLQLPNIRVDGFHIYSGTQCLQTEALVGNYANFVRIFCALSERFDLRPRQLVFGSGLGVPYYLDDKPVDLPAVTSGMRKALEPLLANARFANCALLLELGRYLVGEAGYYLAGVTRLKRSRGTTIAICDGGMNHHLAACGHMGTVIPRNYRMFSLPLRNEHEAGVGEHKYDVVGPLCTSIDRLARNVLLPPLEAGDVIAVECSGAYGLTASPFRFISHPPAKEIVFERAPDGSIDARNASELPEIC